VPAPILIPLYLVPGNLSGNLPVPSQNPSLNTFPSLRARSSFSGIFNEISRLFNELNDVRLNFITLLSSALSLKRASPPT